MQPKNNRILLNRLITAVKEIGCRKKKISARYGVDFAVK
jgi:hypothetical protein